MAGITLRALTSFGLAVAVAACGGSGSAVDGSVSNGDAGPGTVDIRAGFCTTWNDGPVFHVECLSSEGAWETFTRAADPGDEPQMCGGGGPQLAGYAGTGMLMVHRRCVGVEPALVVDRAADTAWEPLGASLNDGGTGAPLPIYAQFGPALISFQGVPYATWTQSPSPGTQETAFSRYVGTSWQRGTVVAAPDVYQRHPTFFATEASLYVHYGEPVPTVWEIAGGNVTPRGAVAISADEWTLYSSLTSWNGQLVLAYSSGPKDASWADSTLVTKVAFHDGGTGWTVDPNPIEDTPGHDGMVPFLFTVGSDLHIMYADYTTEGLPQVVGSHFRFRVKRFTGSAWEAVGPESPPITNSQRLEYLLDGETVLVAVIRPVPGGGERIVLGWRGGSFGQIGDVIATSPRWDPRPGAVVPPPPGI